MPRFSLALAAFSMVLIANAQTRIPGTPAAVIVSNGAVGTVEVNWTDNSADETHFEVRRRLSPCYTDPDANAGCLDTYTFRAPADAQSFSDTTVPDGLTLTYDVRACDAGGCTGWSATASIVTPVTEHSVSGRVVDKDFEPVEDVTIKLSADAVERAYGQDVSDYTAKQTRTIDVQVTQDFEILSVSSIYYNVDYRLNAGAVRIAFKMIHPDGTEATLADSGKETSEFYIYENAASSNNANSPLRAFIGKRSAGIWQLKLEITSSNPSQLDFDYSDSRFGGFDLGEAPFMATATTALDGRYSLNYIPGGYYNISASKAGMTFSAPRRVNLRKDATRQHFLRE